MLALGLRRAGSATGRPTGRTRLVHLDLLKIPPLRAGPDRPVQPEPHPHGRLLRRSRCTCSSCSGSTPWRPASRCCRSRSRCSLASAVGSRLSARFPVRTIVRAGLWHHRRRRVGAPGHDPARRWPTPASPSPWPCSGVGMGLMASQLGNVVQSSVDASGRGEAGGLQYTGQQLGSSLGVALIGAIVLAGLTGAFVTKIEDDPRDQRRDRDPGRASRSGPGIDFVAADRDRRRGQGGRAGRRHHRGHRRRLRGGPAPGAEGRAPGRRAARAPLPGLHPGPPPRRPDPRPLDGVRAGAGGRLTTA